MIGPEPTANSQSAAGQSPARRRLGDDGPTVLLTDANTVSGKDGAGGLTPLDIDTLARALPSLEQLSRAVFLVSLPGGDLLALSGSDAHVLPRGQRADDLRRRTTAISVAWQRERYRRDRLMRMPDWLMVYIDDLHAAATADHVYQALIACVPKVVGAFTTLVYAAQGAEPALEFAAHQDPTSELDLQPLPAHVAATFDPPCVIAEVEATHDARFAALQGLFRAFGAAQLVCTIVGSAALLVLVERRRSRVFTADDRDLLRWLVRQANHRIDELTRDGFDEPAK